MLSLINWKILLYGIAILGIGIFAAISCKKKVEIDDTVISLKEVNDIGELITAEYYGEVLSGLSMIYYEELDTLMKYNFDEIISEVASVEEEIDKVFEPKMVAISETEDGEALNEREQRRVDRKQRRLEKRKQRKFLRKLRKESSIETKASFKELKSILDLNNRKTIETLITESESSNTWEAFKQKHAEEINEYKEDVKRRITKNELIYIGRGTVKAGYDLTEISENNILLSLTGDTVYIVDIDPKLLNVDINPWFYIPPEFEGNESEGESDSSSFFGFQLVYANNPKKTTLEEINKVKSECKSILRRDAIDRQIYDKAKENAETSLEGLFGLLSLEPGQTISKVFISHSKYFYDKVDILYDEKIDSTELNYLRELVADDLEELDEEFYPYQSLEYQQKILDNFMMELSREVLGKDNAKDWDAFISNYINERRLNTNELL